MSFLKYKFWFHLKKQEKSKILVWDEKILCLFERIE